MTVLIAIETAVVVLLSLLVAGLLRSHAETLRRLRRLESESSGSPREAPVDFRVHEQVPSPPSARPGFTPAADVVGIGVSDDAISIPVSGTGHATLLAFLSGACATCASFWEAFAAPVLGLPDGVRLVVVTQGPTHESPRTVASLAPAGVTTVMSDDAWRDYDVPGSPYFVLIDGQEGKVRGEGTGASWEQVLRLIGEAAERVDVVTHSARTEADPTRASGRDRADRIDRELLAAGIRPGDPSLNRAIDGPGGQGGSAL